MNSNQQATIDQVFARYMEHGHLQSQEHQQEGVHWCIAQEQRANHQGGILADEMGLGKTITMMATLLCNVRKTLIVLPVVLINQWVDQLKTTIGHEPFVYYGAQKKDITDYQLQHGLIVVTSYQTLLHDFKTDKRLSSICWPRIIFDEAHFLRSKKSKIYECVSKLNKQITWLLTATPMQNKKQDFYALCGLLNYSTSETKSIIDSNISQIMLRRTRDQTNLTNTEVTHHEIVIPWSEEEKSISHKIHMDLEFSNLYGSTLLDPTQGKVLMFKRLNQARQLCIYPPMVDVLNENPLISDLNISRDEMEVLSTTRKLDKLIETIVSRQNNNKKIIFTLYHKEMTHIQTMLMRNNISHALISGKTSKAQKSNILKESPDVLVMQIRVGCEGLNLQQYNEIYMLTPNWNPYMEDQAIGRCDRQGQTKPVEIFRFVMGELDEQDLENQLQTMPQPNENEPARTRNNIELYTKQVQHNKRQIWEQIVGEEYEDN